MDFPAQHEPSAAALEAYLLGRVEYEACLALQQRLVYESTGRNDGQVSLLLCEHPAIITMGRRGSRSHLFLDQRELDSRGLDVRWVNHGGGCLVHGPGQLAVYPIVPLWWHRFSVGQFLRRLQDALAAALQDLNYQPKTEPGRFGLWGRSGQLAALGVAVKSWTTYHGAFLNVSPSLEVFRRIVTDPAGRTPMSSLAAEKRSAVKMSRVRSVVVRRLSESLGCGRFHLYSGHPLLTPLSAPPPKVVSRVG